MDFTRLIRHCQEEHGITPDISTIKNALQGGIFDVFMLLYDKPLLETELYDILATLQPKYMQQPDFWTGWRPNWDEVDAKWKFCTIDLDGTIFFYDSPPYMNERNGEWDNPDFPIKYPYTLPSPVENWQQCFWVRP